MIEQHYGNDVPTGPIPVVAPEEPDAPASARPVRIPAPRSESSARPGAEPDDRPVLAATRRRRWPWVLLGVLVVLAVVTTVVLGQGGTAPSATPSVAPVTEAPSVTTATPPSPLVATPTGP